MPNDIATYSDIRECGYSATSPLFKRDIEKIDQQDDNAATRLLSAATLEWFQMNKPDSFATISYLFVMGELVDAYQNRFITIPERVRMVMNWEDLCASADPPSWHVTRMNKPDSFATISYLFVMGELVDAYQNRFITIPERVRMVMNWEDLCSLPQYSEEELVEIHAKDTSEIAKFLSDNLPAIQLANEPVTKTVLSLPISYSDHSTRSAAIDLSQLVALQKAHQTRQAELGVRTQIKKGGSHVDSVSALGSGASATASSPLGNELEVPMSLDTAAQRTARQQIIHDLNEIVKQHKEHAVGTGAERSLQWDNTATTSTAGNAANAAAVSTAAATRALTLRRQVSKKLALPQEVEDAGITSVRLLATDSTTKYAFVYYETHIALAKVIAFHSRSGGKNGKLGYISSHGNIAGVTHLYCQLHEHDYSSRFRQTPTSRSLGRNKTFLPPKLFGLLMSPQYLCALKIRPRELPTGDLILSEQDSTMYDTLKSNIGIITSFVSTLMKPKKKSATIDVTGDDEED
ncbi:hypothetical protein CVT24_008275 [Panaeolus cyanescens]|uniref:Uncharacterized protein n=1 Tax=Panaeolus cyanescens TaxID=181874 RepID=A0A409YR41_9AGAR|nr:hypothetical protein CVT24_008275 [Panaeolus cyanescens]